MPLSDSFALHFDNLLDINHGFQPVINNFGVKQKILSCPQQTEQYKFETKDVPACFGIDVGFRGQLA